MISQIELLDNKELIKDMMDISKFFIENFNQNENEYRIIIGEYI
jgi:hypothetical protein